MNTMLNINPWSFFSDLLDTDSRAFKSLTARAAGRFPPINVYFNDNAILVDVELPGKTAKDVNLALDAQAITIAAKPQNEVDTGKSAETRPAQARTSVQGRCGQDKRKIHGRDSADPTSQNRKCRHPSN